MISYRKTSSVSQRKRSLPWPNIWSDIFEADNEFMQPRYQADNEDVWISASLDGQRMTKNVWSHAWPREVFEATQANCQPHWSLDSDVVTYTHQDYNEASTFILHTFSRKMYRVNSKTVTLLSINSFCLKKSYTIIIFLTLHAAGSYAQIRMSCMQTQMWGRCSRGRGRVASRHLTL